MRDPQCRPEQREGLLCHGLKAYLLGLPDAMTASVNLHSDTA